jgi:hypothetical protein
MEPGGRTLMTTQCLQIDLISLDFQSPENLIDSVVNDYVEQMVRGEKLKPILVCFDGKRYLLKDGFHRLEAARRLKHQTISAEVTEGTLEQMEAEFQQMLRAIKQELRR